MCTLLGHLRKKCIMGMVKPTWHDHLVAGLAPVAILAGATRATHDLAVVPGAEGLVSQGLVALGTAEAVLVPVTILMVQLLDREEGGKGVRCIHSHGLPTHLIKLFRGVRKKRECPSGKH